MHQNKCAKFSNEYLLSGRRVGCVVLARVATLCIATTETKSGSNTLISSYCSILDLHATFQIWLR